MMEVRPATTADVLNWYGELPARRMRAMVGIIDNETVGIAGLVFYKDTAIAFCELKEAAYTHKLTIMKAAKRLVRMMDEFGGHVVAVADEEEANAAGFLGHLGFTPDERFNDVEIYRWRN